MSMGPKVPLNITLTLHIASPNMFRDVVVGRWEDDDVHA